jgi:hypothetical protein
MKVKKSERMSYQVPLRMNKAKLNKLDKICSAEGRSRSAWIRWVIVNEYIRGQYNVHKARTRK